MGRRILVWDWPTRLFHWLTVVLVVAAYATWRANWMDWHAWCGEALLALVLFRLLWGFFGSDTARFRRFLAPPAAALRHLGAMFRREPDLQIGHNPAGGWMVLLLLALLLGETLSGLYVNNDVADVGPLTPYVSASAANFITALHLVFWYALEAAVALHLAAIAVYAVAKRQNLLLPMLTGWKDLPDAAVPPRFASTARALVLLAASTLVTAVLSTSL